MIALWDSQAGWTEAALIAAAVIILAGVLLLQPGEPTFPPAGPAEGTAQRASRVLRIVKQGGEPCPPQRRTYDAEGDKTGPSIDILELFSQFGAMDFDFRQFAWR